MASADQTPCRNVHADPLAPVSLRKTRLKPVRVVLARWADNPQGVLTGFGNTNLAPALGPAQLVLDFGREIVGGAAVQVSLAQASCIELYYGLTVEESLRTGADDTQPTDVFQRELGPWVLRSGGRRTFRYLHVRVPAEGASAGKVALEQVWAEHAIYPAEPRGVFFCSDPRLNAVWQAAQHTLGLCMQQVYEQNARREGKLYIPAYRIGYLANAHCFGDVTLACKSLYLAASGQRKDGSLPAYASTLGADGLTQAEQSLVQLNACADWLNAINEYHLYSGDRETLADLWPTVERLVRYLCVDVHLQNLAAPRDCATSEQPDDTDRWGSVGTVAMQLVWALRDARALASRLTKPETEALAMQAIQLFAHHIERHHYDADAALYTDGPNDTTSRSRHVNALAVLSGLAEGATACDLLSRTTQQGDVLRPVTGPMRVWQAAAHMLAGQAEDSLSLMREWPVPAADGPALEESGPAYLLSRWVLGAEPAQPGWRRVRIQPQLGNLAWAHGNVPTPLGDIQLRWEKTPHLSGVITLPAGMEGEAIIACGGRETVHALKPGVNALS